MGIRSYLRVDAFIFDAFLGIVAWGGTVWLKKHRLEVKQDKQYRAETRAETAGAKAALARLKSTWNADNRWEDVYSAPGSLAPAYSLEVQHALMRGRPIIVFGQIQDIQASADPGSSVVTIESQGLGNNLNLRLSLVSATDAANKILHETRADTWPEFTTYIFVATITKVEKVEMPPDKEGNDEDYFLAHGILHEAYDTHLPMADQKEISGN